MMVYHRNIGLALIWKNEDEGNERHALGDMVKIEEVQMQI
jgi:hypothetical protein